MNGNGCCDVTEWSKASYGPLFDQAGEGVIAMKWDENGISVCERHFFPTKISLSKVALGSFFRAAVPDDITQGSPSPRYGVLRLPRLPTQIVILNNILWTITLFLVSVFACFFSVLNDPLRASYNRYYFLRYVILFLIYIRFI